VENYVSANRMTDDGYRKDYPKPEVQKEALRTVIRRLNADVLVLQEMGNQSYLDELRRDLKHDGVDYAHAVLLLGPDPDRHVAMLSKRPFSSVIQHTDLEFRYFGGKEKVKRGVLEATIQTAVGEVTLFGVHLKSRFTDRSDDVQSAERRQGEAVAIRDCVLTRFPDPAHARFLILGDFNDDKSSKTLQRLTRRGPVPIAQLLSIADARGERWTHAYKKQDNYTRVDHILVSAGLFPAVRDSVGQIDDGAGVLIASDHRPVVVVIEFPDKK
jgi:endonuclease/exonuclease/phosphatase family metal-dependent hydrolase